MQPDATPVSASTSTPETAPSPNGSEGSCRVVKSATMYEGKQELQFFAGISAESTGARGICMHLQTIPPGAVGRAHRHDEHETALFVLKGRAACRYGPNLEHYLAAGPGDFVYVPANVPHMPLNLSDTEPAEFVVARTDPKEQESTVLLPDLESDEQDQQA